MYLSRHWYLLYFYFIDFLFGIHMDSKLDTEALMAMPTFIEVKFEYLFSFPTFSK